jgi:hypothetical protein
MDEQQIASFLDELEKIGKANALEEAEIRDQGGKGGLPKAGGGVIGKTLAERVRPGMFKSIAQLWKSQYKRHCIRGMW